MGKCDEVTVVGLATPNVDEAAVRHRLCPRGGAVEPGRPRLCRPVTCCAPPPTGRSCPGATSLKAGRLGNLRVEGSAVLLGMPFVFTADNAGDFDF